MVRVTFCDIIIINKVEISLRAYLPIPLKWLRFCHLCQEAGPLREMLAELAPEMILIVAADLLLEPSPVHAHSSSEISPASVGSGDLCHIIYTSGSSGVDMVQG